MFGNVQHVPDGAERRALQVEIFTTGWVSKAQSALVSLQSVFQSSPIERVP